MICARYEKDLMRFLLLCCAERVMPSLCQVFILMFGFLFAAPAMTYLQRIRTGGWLLCVHVAFTIYFTSKYQTAARVYYNFNEFPVRSLQFSSETTRRCHQFFIQFRQYSKRCIFLELVIKFI